MDPKAILELKGKKQETLIVRLGIPTVYGGEDVKGGQDTLGKPVNFSYMVHHYEDGTPFFSQPPVRKSVGFGSCLHPVADNPSIPEISTLGSFL